MENSTLARDGKTIERWVLPLPLLNKQESMCNKDYQQGPEKFIEPDPEIIQTSSIVLWYVAQMTNDDTKGNEYCWAESVLKNGVYVPVIYPCYSGPMFKPY